jgi:RNA-binding protein
MLSKAHRKSLRALAHGRGVVVRVGQNGLTENVLAEIGQALDHHELIKISVRVGDREERDAVVKAILEHTGAEAVQKIGNTVVLYRRNRRNPVIVLPKN